MITRLLISGNLIPTRIFLESGRFIVIFPIFIAKRIVFRRKFIIENAIEIMIYPAGLIYVDGVIDSKKNYIKIEEANVYDVEVRKA